MDAFQGLVWVLHAKGLVEHPVPKGEGKAPAAYAHDCISVLAQHPCLATPLRYDGSLMKCLGFIMQCELVFTSLPKVCCTDETKITYVLVLLTGLALQWAIADCKSSMQATYENFKKRFQQLERDFPPG
uniref:DUF4939 domain-containing protein n=1 Tax=Scleropages formosus TaxID=113540 RepID=A0A8C9S013_SCLFO